MSARYALRAPWGALGDVNVILIECREGGSGEGMFGKRVSRMPWSSPAPAGGREKTRGQGKNGGKKCETDVRRCVRGGTGVSLVEHWYLLLFLEGKKGKNK